MVSSPASFVSSASPASRSPLARTLDSVRASLGRFQAAFEAARGQCAELAPFGSLEAVASALDASSPMPPPERYALVAALAREHQRQVGGPALWSSLLLVVFRPLLLSARTQMGRPEDPERDGEVVAAFLDALARLDVDHVGDYAAVALQRATLKAVARGRAIDRRDADATPFDEDVHTRCDPHALTLGDACADLAWADARERKLAAIVRWKSRRADAVTRTPKHASSASLRSLHATHATTTLTGVSP